MRDTDAPHRVDAVERAEGVGASRNGKPELAFYCPSCAAREPGDRTDTSGRADP